MRLTGALVRLLLCPDARQLEAAVGLGGHRGADLAGVPLEKHLSWEHDVHAYLESLIVRQGG